MPTINGVNYTPFEENKNATELGIDLSRKFIVVKESDHSPKVGDILEIKENDNSRNPYFWNLTRDNLGGGSKHDTENKWMCVAYWNQLAYYDEQKHLRNTIITNIRNKEQHKRVQKKLFEMGNYGIGSYQDYADTIKIYKEGCFNSLKSSCDVFQECSNWPHITADEFLGEYPQTPSGDTLGSLGCYDDITDATPKGDESDYVTVQNSTYIDFKFNTNTPTDTSIAKGNKIMSIITNAFKSKEDKALEYFNLGDSKQLNEEGRREFVNYIFETGDTTKKGFLSKMVEAYKEEKK